MLSWGWADVGGGHNLRAMRVAESDSPRICVSPSPSFAAGEARTSAPHTPPAFLLGLRPHISLDARFRFLACLSLSSARKYRRRPQSSLHLRGGDTEYKSTYLASLPFSFCLFSLPSAPTLPRQLGPHHLTPDELSLLPRPWLRRQGHQSRAVKLVQETCGKKDCAVVDTFWCVAPFRIFSFSLGRRKKEAGWRGVLCFLHLMGWLLLPPPQCGVVVRRRKRRVEAHARRRPE
jgi:hypothetical protein